MDFYFYLIQMIAADMKTVEALEAQYLGKILIELFDSTIYCNMNYYRKY